MLRGGKNFTQSVKPTFSRPPAATGEDVIIFYLITYRDVGGDLPIDWTSPFVEFSWLVYRMLFQCQNPEDKKPQVLNTTTKSNII